MLMIGQQKVDTLTLVALGVVAAVVCGVSILAPQIMPWSFLVLGAVPFLMYWAIRWDVSIWAWLWVLSFGLLDWPEWRFSLGLHFKMSVPRFILLTGLIVFVLHSFFRARRLRFDRAVLWAMLALTGYVAISATVTGWAARTTDVASAPFFRFLAGILFPFVMFLVVYNVTCRQRQIPWALVLLSVYGWYALYTGYLQFAAIGGLESARQWIWPAYINDPQYGIHFDRARGAFVGAGPQAMFLVLLFYADLYLIRKVRGPYRPALVLQAVLVPAAIFFTGLRSAYVAFLVCGVIWCLIGNRRRFGGFKLAAAAIVLLVAVLGLWENIWQTDRQTGGIAQRGPVEARKILAYQTWEIFTERPLFGVGFGHFVDAQQRVPRDPASPVGLSTGVLVQHNLFLSMLAETGLVGLAGIIAVFVLLFRQSLQLYRRLPASAAGWLSRGFVALFWVALANFITDAMFRDTLWDAFANGLLWSLAGLVVGYNRLLEAAPADLSPAESIP